MLTIRGAKWYENIKRLGTPVLEYHLISIFEYPEHKKTPSIEG